MIIWITGQPGSGKTALAQAVTHRLWESGVELGIRHIDGDHLRELVPITQEDTGGKEVYSKANRRQNIDRALAIALYLESTVEYPVILVSLVSPYRAQRESLREKCTVMEVYLTCSEERGKEDFFAEGYEPPLIPDLQFNTSEVSVEREVEEVCDLYWEMAATS